MHRSAKRIRYLRVARTVGVLLQIGIVGGCGKTTPEHPPRFNPSDIHETARWAAQTSKALNSIPVAANQIARNDAVESEKANAEAEIAALVGQAVAWQMECYVSEMVVGIAPNMYGQDGSAILSDRESNRVALMILDDRPKVTSFGLPSRGVDPASWFFQLDVPDQISREEAAKLPEKVVVSGRIKEIEVERFRDRELEDYERSDEDAWYLLYLYLTDVTLAPAGE